MLRKRRTVFAGLWLKIAIKWNKNLKNPMGKGNIPSFYLGDCITVLFLCPWLPPH